VIGIVAGALAIAVLTWTAQAQQAQTGGHQAQTGGRQAQHQESSARQEIFCEGLSAGQLCLHGTVDVLKLDAAKQASWREAGQRYNKAVDAATKQFLADAKPILSPQDFAKVEKWFDKSVNGYINQQLLASTSKH
jgi:hypothetical protein